MFEERISVVYADSFILADQDDEESTACEGISDEQLEKFQLKDEETKSFPEKGVLNTMCPICLETLNSQKILCKLPCHHVFHHGYFLVFDKKIKRCVKTWLVRNTTCPQCRLNLTYL